MSRWWLVLVLAVAPASAWAQPSATPTVAVATPTAQAALTKAERAVADKTAARNTLAKQYEDQLKAVDRLKQQRASWRRDRELKEALATAQATATKLGSAATELGTTTAHLAVAKRALLDAIDRELAANPAPARAAELARQKAQLSPAPAKRNLTKIVIPDLEIDPLADPEELDAQAAELARAEKELASQQAGFDQQAKELDDIAKLRKQHDRAGVLAQRDDDQPQRTAREPSVGRQTADSPANIDSGGASPPEGDHAGGIGGSEGGAQIPSFSDASVVLSNVVDATTIDTLSKAAHSNDPAVRAQAAKRARDAVQLRLEQLRKKRLEIEAAARQRRAH
ncbi:MAG TPA: hypothetical protein VGM39_14080 [Kofleriaceae bacterium]|jgi:hypothetical protein